MRSANLLITALAVSLSACTSLPRAPLDDNSRPAIPGIPEARLTAEEGYRYFAPPGKARAPLTILALSGGGADGSFGAGFLKGWTESGNRPHFDIVTGSSVGALIAPFAYLGSDYDDRIAAVFNGNETDDLMRVSSVNAIFGAGAFKVGPLKDLISKYADDTLIDAVAVRHRQGKLLVIATTNLDTQHTTLWNMGAVASSNNPERYSLFRTVLAASAAIPGIFPPAQIPVVAGGNSYIELHVDGGVTSNVLAIPESVLTHSAPLPAKSRIFVIVNGKLSPDAAYTSNITLPIIARSFQTAVKANTRNAMIATYDFCKRNKWDFSFAAIDNQRRSSSDPTDFDPNYMAELYAFGRAKALRSGHGFQKDLETLSGRAS